MRQWVHSPSTVGGGRSKSTHIRRSGGSASCFSMGGERYQKVERWEMGSDQLRFAKWVQTSREMEDGIREVEICEIGSDQLRDER